MTLCIGRRLTKAIEAFKVEGLGLGLGRMLVKAIEAYKVEGFRGLGFPLLRHGVAGIGKEGGY